MTLLDYAKESLWNTNLSKFPTKLRYSMIKNRLGLP